MRLLWFTSIFLCLLKPLNAWFWGTSFKTPWLEKYHYPGYYTTALAPAINGTEVEIMTTYISPDFRVEEKLYVVYGPFMKEQERPYRLSPHYKQTYRWTKVEQAKNLGCYCCTVYRKYVLLGGCAVITTRHLLTTATSTDLILRTYGHLPRIDKILGAWYDHDANLFNSSLYTAPARIHFHPMYRYDYEVNVSHPIPCMYDLSVWAATYRFYGHSLSLSGAILCYRAASGWMTYASSIPRPSDLGVVVGYQFMKSYKRRPLPWYKYGVRTKSYVLPCPKTEWHWFTCVKGEYWGRFGFDSGGSLHLMFENKDGRSDGFAGMCAFSLKLRSHQITHYFTVVDTYPVLDYFYQAFMGTIPYVYLDKRFQNTKWGAPVAWWGEYVYEGYVFGFEYYAFNPIAYF